MSLTITANDLPDVINQLDTIAEHDLDVAYDASAPFSEDDFDSARRAIRDARSALIRAIDLLHIANDGDDD